MQVSAAQRMWCIPAHSSMLTCACTQLCTRGVQFTITCDRFLARHLDGPNTPCTCISTVLHCYALACSNCIGLFAAPAIQSMCENHYTYLLYMMGTRMRNSLMAAIYRKCLRLSNSALQVGVPCRKHEGMQMGAHACLGGCVGNLGMGRHRTHLACQGPVWAWGGACC